MSNNFLNKMISGKGLMQNYLHAKGKVWFKIENSSAQDSKHFSFSQLILYPWAQTGGMSYDPFIS